MTVLRLFFLLWVALLGPCAAAELAAADDDVIRSFQKGRVHFSQAGSARAETIASAWPTLKGLDRSAFKATVVYLHGCSGINTLSLKTADLLAAAGYLVFLPDGFARRHKPVSCVAREHKGSLHRDVLGWRHAEADYALKQAKTLRAVDPARIFLIGLSEGAIAIATYVGEALTGRVIEGWTCHAGWPEYRGLQAPAQEAVLALSSENDPWFQIPVLRGDCGAFMGASSPLRRSVVFRAPHPAASEHDLMWNQEARGIVLDFLDLALAAIH